MKAIPSKKGQVNTMGPAIIALVIAGVFLIMGLIIIQNLRDTDVLITGEVGCNATGTEACIALNGANTTLVGMSSFADFWEIIVLAVVITIVIGLLLVVFGGRRAR